MTPEELKRWQQEHGGPSGEPETDANGNVTHRAADGNYVVVRPNGTLAMRGMRPPTAGSAPTMAQAPATAAPSPPPGSGQMSQAQLEALLKQVAPNGDPNRLEFNQGSKTKTVRSGGGIMGAETETVQVPYVQWIDRATGQTLEADIEPGGGAYTVTFNGVKKENQGAQATTPTQAQQQRPGKKREPVKTHPGYYEVTTTDPENNTSETHYEDANGRRVEKLPPTEAETRANAPKPQQGPDGQWGYFDTSTPGQQPRWVPIAGPQASPKPVQVNGQWGIWQPNASDPKQPPTFVTIEVPKPGITLKNVDTWEPDFSQPDLGLGKWAASQRQKIGLSAEQGGITQKDYDDAVKEAHERGGVTVSNLTSSNTVIRQQQQDEEGRRVARSGEAAADFDNALGVFNQVWKLADPNTGSIRNLIPGLMAEQQKYRREREGDAKPLPGLHPMFQIASAQSAATARPPAATEQAAGTGPTPEPYKAPGMPEPVFRPQPPVDLAPNAAPAVPPPPVGAAPAAAPAMAAPPPAAPPPAPVAPPQADVFSPVQGNVRAAATPTMPGPTDYTSPGAVEMPDGPSSYGAAGDMPKVSMGAGPLTAFAQAATPPPSPGGAPLSGFVDQAQQMGEGGFDPIARAADLERMGVPHEIAVQALVQSGILDAATRRRLGMVA